MVGCPDANCRLDLEREINLKVSSKNAKWAVGIAITIVLCMAVYLGDSASRAQDKAEASQAELKKEIAKARDARQEIKLDVEGMKKDIEHIRESQERQEKTNDKILEALDKMNGDGDG